jgi:hypothetical protein
LRGRVRTGGHIETFLLIVSAVSLILVPAFSDDASEERGNREELLDEGLNFRDDFNGAVNFGPSFGFYPGQDKYFWGFSGGYTRFLENKWSVTATLAWDEEIERINNQPDSKIHSFTAIATVNYNLTDWSVLSAGVGNGFLDDDNPQKRYEFGIGDWSVGTSVGYAWPIHEALDFVLSGALEYNLNQNEVDISFDGGLAVPF